MDLNTEAMVTITCLRCWLDDVLAYMIHRIPNSRSELVIATRLDCMETKMLCRSCFTDGRGMLVMLLKVEVSMHVRIDDG